MADDNNLEFRLGMNTSGVEEGSRRAKASVGSVSQSADQLGGAFRRLKSAIDPTFAATEKFNRSMAEYDRLLKSGAMDQETYAKGTDLIRRAYETQIASIEKNSSAAKRAAAEKQAALLKEAQDREAAARQQKGIADEWLAQERKNSQAIRAEAESRAVAEKKAIMEAAEAARTAAREKVAALREGGSKITKAEETAQVRAAAAAAKTAAAEKLAVEHAANDQIRAEYQKTYEAAKVLAQEAAQDAVQTTQARVAAEKAVVESLGQVEVAERREAKKAAQEAAAAAVLSGKETEIAAKKAAIALKEQQQATEEAAKAARRQAEAANELRAQINPTFAAQQRYNQTMQQATALLMSNTLKEGEWIAIQKMAKIQMEINARQMGRNNQVGVQLGYQMQDVTASLASGINPMVIFAQQAGQVAYALQGAGGAAGRFAAVLGGVWFQAILAAVTVLAMLWKSEEDGKKKTEDLMDAEWRRTATLKELTHALKEYVKNQRAANDTTAEAKRLAIEATAANAAKLQSDAGVARQNLEDAKAALAIAMKTPAGDAATQGAMYLGQQILIDRLTEKVNAAQRAYDLAARSVTEANIAMAEHLSTTSKVDQQYDNMKQNAIDSARLQEEITKQQNKGIITDNQQKQIASQLTARLTQIEKDRTEAKRAESEATSNLHKEEKELYRSREDAIGRAGHALQKEGYSISENNQFGGVHGNHPGMGNTAHGMYAIDVNLPGYGKGNPEAGSALAKSQMDDMVRRYQQAGFRILWNGKVYEPHGGGPAYDIPASQLQHKDHAHIEAPKSIIGKPAGMGVAGDEAAALQKQLKDEHEALVADIEFKKEMAGQDLAIVLKLQEQKIDAIKAFYGAESKEALNAERERVRIQRQLDRQTLEEKKKGIEQRVALEEIAQKKLTSLEAANMQQRRAMIDFLESNGLITRQQAIAQKAALIEQEYQQQVAHEEAMYQLAYDSEVERMLLPHMTLQERADINRQIERQAEEHAARMLEIELGHAAQVNQINRDSQEEYVSRWRGMSQAVTGSLRQSLQGFWTHSLSFRQAMINMADAIVFKFMDMGVELVQNWIMSQFKILTVKKTTDAAMKASSVGLAAAEKGIQAATTAASVATQAIKTGAAVTGAGVQTAAAATAGTAEIGTNAAVAAAGAYKSTVVIPFIGPVAAPAAAALALAAVLGFGALISARGGLDEVPDDQLAMVHKKEMILPAWIAEPMRQSLRGGARSAQMFGAASTAGSSARSDTTNNGGDTLNFHYGPQHTNMGADMETLLRADGSSLRKWIKNEVRNGGLKFK